MKHDPLIRSANLADAVWVQSIYAHYVAHSTATFDTKAPDVDFWRSKIERASREGWPFLVVEADGGLSGYAYATRFRDRAAYAHTCEDSIYIADGHQGQGHGARLLGGLIEAAREARFQQMIAVIGGGEPASIALHRKLGFVDAGRMRNVGRKFGRLLDTVYMQCDLRGETPS